MIAVFRPFAGRLRGILVAWLATVALAFGYSAWAEPHVFFPSWRLYALIILTFIGVPALLCITCLMIPVYAALRRHGAKMAVVGVICANMSLVAFVWAFGLRGTGPGPVTYIAFAMIAACIWLVADWFFGRNLRA